MTTYATLRSRIADEIARSDLTSNINSAILDAIKHYERERFWWNEKRDTASTVANQQSYAMPDSAAEFPLIFADQLTITVNSSIYDLPQINHSELVRRTTNASHTGEPSHWSYFQDAVWLYPIPNGVYTLTLLYVGQLAALSADGDTNAWVVTAEELIRSRAKHTLYRHVIRDREMADQMMFAERDALNNLRGHRDIRMASEVTPWL